MKFPALQRPGAIATIVAVWLLSHTPLASAGPPVGAEDT